jgi:hypothetical protein
LSNATRPVIFDISLFANLERVVLMPEKVHTRYIRLSAIVTVVILALLILSSVIFLFLLNKERAQGQAAQKVTPSATGSTPSVTRP